MPSNARVVVLGYPELYDLSKSSTCIGLSTTDRRDLNAAADELTAVPLRPDAGGDVFADVRSAFAGREICTPATGCTRLQHPRDVSESYHPTAAGQADAYEPVSPPQRVSPGWTVSPAQTMWPPSGA